MCEVPLYACVPVPCKGYWGFYCASVGLSVRMARRDTGFFLDLRKCKWKISLHGFDNTARSSRNKTPQSQAELRGYLARKKQPPPLGPPRVPRRGLFLMSEVPLCDLAPGFACLGERKRFYRGTSLIRNSPPPEDYHRALCIVLL